MTRDQIAAMPAGREMDALVVEQVMGWQKHSYADGRYWWWHNGDDKVICVNGDEPSFSTDIAAAWQAVEHLAAKDYRLSLEDRRDVDPSHPAHGWAALVTLPDGHDTGDAMGETVPLAVCRAILFATMRRG